jgi:hypothetical protein
VSLVVNSLDRFEGFFERLMEGSVGRIFRSPVQPAEIGRRLERAMESNQVSTVEGIVVPNDYVVYLHPDDMVLFSDFATNLCHQMEDWLIDLAEERNYGFIDQVRIQLYGDEKVPMRSIIVDAQIVELGDYDPDYQEQIQRTEVYRVVEHTGDVPPKLVRAIRADGHEQSFMIRKRVSSIGRSTTNDIVIEIPEVSRQHARIEYHNGSFRIIDLGSTNGTMVNGRRVTDSEISDHDEIMLGTARLEIAPYRSSVGR